MLTPMQNIEVYPISKCEFAGFYLDIRWTDKLGITLKATKKLYFKDHWSEYNDTNIFQNSCIIEQMSDYFPILNKMVDKSNIKKAISKAVIEMDKHTDSESFDTIKHLKLIYNNDKIYIDIRAIYE